MYKNTFKKDKRKVLLTKTFYNIPLLHDLFYFHEKKNEYIRNILQIFLNYFEINYTKNKDKANK